MPVGAAGPVVTCSGGDEASDAPRPAPLRGHTSMLFGWSRSHLAFDGGELLADVDHGAALVTSDLFFDRVTLTLGAGASPFGTIRSNGEEASLGAGPMLTGGVSWRVVDGAESLPFVILALTLGGLHAPVTSGDQRGTYDALDLRFSGTVGKTFFGWLGPYASLRVFGGPVFWSLGDTTRVGTDRYHVQGSLGAVFVLPEGFDLLVEGSPGGEQAGQLAVGYRY